MRWIENQPVIFNQATPECPTNGRDWSQPIKSGDVTHFQFEVSPCSYTPDQVTDGGFTSSSNWNLGTNWVISGGQACHASGASSQLSQSGVFTSSSANYRVNVTVSGMTKGSLVVKGGLITLGTILTNGSYTFYYSSVVTTSSLVFQADSDFDGCVDQTSVFILSKKHKVIIYDLDGNAQSVLENSDGYFNYTKQWLSVRVDWTALGIVNGCYYIGVADPCENTCSQLLLVGQDFIDSTLWSFGQNSNTTWTMSGGTLGYSSTNTSGSGNVDADASICDTITYNVTYTISNLVGAANVYVSLGGTNGTTRTANGTYTEQITSAGTLFQFITTSSVNPTSFDITDLTIEAIDEDIAPEFTSNEFNLQDHCCTLVINQVCNENSLGFGFVDTNFNPTTRLEAKLFPSSSVGERIVNEDVNGTVSTKYGRVRMGKRLRIINTPDWIWNFLFLTPYSDQFYVNNVEYQVREDEVADPRPNRFQYLFTGDIEIGEKTQLIENRECDNNVVIGTIGDEQNWVTSQGEAITTSLGLQITFQII